MEIACFANLGLTKQANCDIFFFENFKFEQFGGDNVTILADAKNLADAYAVMLQPLCRQWQLPRTAVDILLFLANNPGSDTATDIVKQRGIKPNLVSMHVERLVNEGYLLREAIPGDRRKVRLQCTDRAQPVITQGRNIQERFIRALTGNIDAQSMQIFQTVMQQILQNAAHILQESAATSKNGKDDRA